MSNDKKNEVPQKSALTDEMKSFAKELVDGLVPQMVATVALANQPKAPAGPPPLVQKEQCRECGQVLKACEGKHTKIIALPLRRPEYAQWFQGYKLNGIRYLSENASQYVTVPAKCAATIVNEIRQWEEAEARMRVGKTKEHFSGKVDQPRRVEEDGTTFL